MCIYCGTTKYRKIYEQHYGKIPKDSDGRSYEIHHIDGNHVNNQPENLRCVSIQEHYDIHKSINDYGSCYAIAVRMKKSHEELSEIARKIAYEKIADGTNPFLRPDVQQKGFEAAKIVNEAKIADGTHNFLGGKIQRETNRRRVDNGTHNWLGSESNRRRIEDGTHNWLNGKGVRQQLENGKHTSQIMKTCEHCGKILDIANYGKWHGKNCRSKVNK